MPTNIFYNVLDVVPGNPVPEDAQLIYRISGMVPIRDGLCLRSPQLETEFFETLYFDSMNENWYNWYYLKEPRNAIQLERAFKYTSIFIDPPDDIPGYRQMVLEDDMTDEEKSKLIARDLGFSENRNENTQQHNTIIHGNRNAPVEVLPQTSIESFCIWCEIHNKLKIEAYKIFPKVIYVGNTNTRARSWWRRDSKELYAHEPRYYFDIGALGFWPIDSANSWQKNWSVLVQSESINGERSIKALKSFNKYTCAEKAAKIYIKKLLNINRRRNFQFPDFKNSVFEHNIVNENGINERITVGLYKESQTL